MYDLKKLEEIHRKRRLGEKLTPQEAKYLKAVIRYDQIGTYSNYAKRIFDGFDFQKFHVKLMDRIDEFVTTPNDRLIITMAPQHGKTLLSGLGLMSYIFGRFPEATVLYLTYNEDRAVAAATQFLEIISSPAYLKIFPAARVRSTADEEEVSKIKKKTHSQTRFLFKNVNSKRGKILFTSLNARFAGNPGDIVVIDDPVGKKEDADSETLREKQWGGLYANVLTRIQAETRVLLCNTHWHPDDLVGRLRKINLHNRDMGIKEWEIVNLPAIVTENNPTNPKYDDRTEVWNGKIECLTDEMLLWPKYKQKYLESMAEPNVFACMYQGKPLEYDGVLFKRQMFRTYYVKPINMHAIIISVDPSFKKNATRGSKCAITVWGLKGKSIYLLDFVNESMDYLETKATMDRLIQVYDDYWVILIEEKANGCALLADMREHYTRIKGFDPKNQTKLQRAQAVLPLFEDGVYVPDKRLNGRVENFVQQFLSFSGGPRESNDLVDSSTQAFLQYIDYFRALGSHKIHSIQSECANMFGDPNRTLRQIGYLNGKKTQIRQIRQSSRHYR